MYQTLDGQLIDRASLTPDELEAFIELCEFIPDLHENVDAINKQELLFPTTIRRAAEGLIIHRLGKAGLEEAFNGPYGEIVRDLTHRLGVLKMGWNPELFTHDPRGFVQDIFDESQSFGDFSQKLGIKPFVADQLIKSVSTDLHDDVVTITTLREIARRTGRSFRTGRASTTKSHGRVTCRDRSMITFGTRVAALASAFRDHRIFLEQVVAREYCAVVGSSERGWRNALHRAKCFIEQCQGSASSAPPHTAVFRLADRSEHYDWLYPAIEWHWFTEFGYTVVLALAHDRIPGVIEQIPSGERTEEHRRYEDLTAMTRFRDLIKFPRFDATAIHEATEPRLDLAEVCDTLRGYYASLRKHPRLASTVDDVVTRWRTVHFVKTS